jgi:hypothetical protein
VAVLLAVAGGAADVGDEEGDALGEEVVGRGVASPECGAALALGAAVDEDEAGDAFAGGGIVGAVVVGGDLATVEGGVADEFGLGEGGGVDVAAGGGGERAGRAGVEVEEPDVGEVAGALEGEGEGAAVVAPGGGGDDAAWERGEGDWGAEVEVRGEFVGLEAGVAVLVNDEGEAASMSQS